MPRVSSLHHPPPCLPTRMAGQARISSAARGNVPAVAFQQHHAMRRSIVIGRIQTQVLRLSAQRARSHNSAVAQQLVQHRSIVDIRRRHKDTQGNTSAINQQMILYPRFTAICRVRTAFFSPLQVRARKCRHLIAIPTQCHASYHRGADTWHGFAQRLQPASTLQNGHRRFATLRTLRATRATGNQPITHREWHQESIGRLCGDDRRVRAMAVEEAGTRPLPIAHQELAGVFSSQHFSKPLWVCRHALSELVRLAPARRAGRAHARRGACAATVRGARAAARWGRRTKPRPGCRGLP